MKNISPLSQAEGKSLQKLLTKKFRSSTSLFIIETPHIIAEALASDWQVEQIVITDSFAGNTHAAQILSAAGRRGVGVRTARESFVKLFTGTVTSPGIFAVVRRKKAEWPGTGGPGGWTVALDGVADPGNVGTIIRTADWFGAHAVVLGKGCAEVYNPKVLRATMGSLFHLPVYDTVDLVDFARRYREQGGTVVAAVSAGGVSLKEARVPAASLLLFGNEAAGIRLELRPFIDREITIPKYGRAESLNVAISCGIILSLLRESG